MKKDKVIAIDGPSGSGKSTIAKMLAEKLDLTYLDTGAMFRGIACVLIDCGVDFEKDSLTAEENSNVESLLEQLEFLYAPEKNVLIKINGEDLTQKIREHDISILTSHVSKFPVIRTYLKNLQRKIAMMHPSILEGRDIGTVIFPNAALKFFLTANNRARAERRYHQLLKKDPGLEATLTVEQVEKDLEQRDLQDSNREVAPLKKSQDAIEINSTDLTIDEVCRVIEEKFKESIHYFQ